MPRTGWKRRWIKLYVTGWLHGSIRWQFTSEERGVWADLLALSGELQQAGKLCDNDGRALPLDFIASQLNIKQSLLDRVITRCKEEGRISEEDGILILTNYETYQSEYERQKPYRERARSGANYTLEMFNEDYDEMTAKIRENEEPFVAPFEGGDMHLATITFFKGKYEEAQAVDFGMRFLVTMDFLNSHQDGLIKEGLGSPTEKGIKADDIVYKVILDSFSPPLPGVRGGFFPTSSLGKLYDLSFDKVLEAVKPLLEGDRLP